MSNTTSRALRVLVLTCFLFMLTADNASATTNGQTTSYANMIAGFVTAAVFVSAATFAMCAIFYETVGKHMAEGYRLYQEHMRMDELYLATCERVKAKRKEREAMEADIADKGREANNTHVTDITDLTDLTDLTNSTKQQNVVQLSEPGAAVKKVIAAIADAGGEWVSGHNELARVAGVSRATVSNAVNKGWIIKDGGAYRTAA